MDGEKTAGTWGVRRPRGYTVKADGPGWGGDGREAPRMEDACALLEPRAWRAT